MNHKNGRDYLPNGEGEDYQGAQPLVQPVLQEGDFSATQPVTWVGID